MKIVWARSAYADYRYWLTNDSRKAEKISRLVADIERSSFAGIGKPEPLKGELAGWWSRRIDKEHRLVYRVNGVGDGRELQIAQCRYHY